MGMQTYKDVLAMNSKHSSSKHSETLGSLSYKFLSDPSLRGEGVFLISEGKKKLDFYSGYGSLALGHNNKEILNAINNAFGIENIVNQLPAVPNKYILELKEALSKSTDDQLPKVIIELSGAGAVGKALKTAKFYQESNGRVKLLSTTNAFHGKSEETMHVTGNPKYMALTKSFIEHSDKVKFGDIQELEAALEKEKYAAFIAEPIEGEAGIIIPPENYFKAVKELCKKHGVLFILDEVQTGLGRTGKMWAYQHYDAVPDILVVSKILSGGIVPAAAVLMREEIYNKVYNREDILGFDYNTFNNMAIIGIVGTKVLEILQRTNDSGKTLIEQGAETGEYILKNLEDLVKFDLVTEVRGKGPMIGIDLVAPTNGVKMLDENFPLVVGDVLFDEYDIMIAPSLNNPRTMRMLIPFTTQKENADHVIKSMHDLFGKYSTHLAFVQRYMANLAK